MLSAVGTTRVLVESGFIYALSMPLGGSKVQAGYTVSSPKIAIQVKE